MHLHIWSLIVCNFSTCIASALSWSSLASPWAFAALPCLQPVSLVPRPYLASHLSCLGFNLLRWKSLLPQSRLGLVKMPWLHHWFHPMYLFVSFTVCMIKFLNNFDRFLKQLTQYVICIWQVCTCGFRTCTENVWVRVFGTSVDKWWSHVSTELPPVVAVCNYQTGKSLYLLILYQNCSMAYIVLQLAQ